MRASASDPGFLVLVFTVIFMGIFIGAGVINHCKTLLKQRASRRRLDAERSTYIQRPPWTRTGIFPRADVFGNSCPYEIDLEGQMRWPTPSQNICRGSGRNIPDSFSNAFDGTASVDEIRSLAGSDYIMGTGHSGDQATSTEEIVAPEAVVMAREHSDPVRIADVPKLPAH